MSWNGTKEKAPFMENVFIISTIENAILHQHPTFTNHDLKLFFQNYLKSTKKRLGLYEKEKVTK